MTFVLMMPATARSPRGKRHTQPLHSRPPLREACRVWQPRQDHRRPPNPKCRRNASPLAFLRPPPYTPSNTSRRNPRHSPQLHLLQPRPPPHLHRPAPPRLSPRLRRLAPRRLPQRRPGGDPARRRRDKRGHEDAVPRRDKRAETHAAGGGIHVDGVWIPGGG